MWALGAIGSVPSGPLLPLLLRRSLERLDSASGMDIANLIWGFARLDCPISEATTDRFAVHCRAPATRNLCLAPVLERLMSSLMALNSYVLASSWGAGLSNPKGLLQWFCRHVLRINSFLCASFLVFGVALSLSVSTLPAVISLFCHTAGQLAASRARPPVYSAALHETQPLHMKRSLSLRSRISWNVDRLPTSGWSE